MLNDFLPGAVTLLFEAWPYINKDLISKTNLIGIRMPDHPFMMHVVRFCNAAIALTSANKSSATSCLHVKEFKQLWPDLDAVFDGGTLGAIDPMRLGSTIVDLFVENSFRIIRNGCALDDVTKILLQLEGKKHFEFLVDLFGKGFGLCPLKCVNYFFGFIQFCFQI
ncbi:L-threonylcarbamoyladenylate synthase [Cardinium endosymbiont of Oedothorax gibbosus]|uniref:L-threonylcarbamoyladenylate synthase n=1 Tax=Cardinium endosymbiont of Oedothorax gibbosus TaxID=931101 RepID=UPI002025228C|nr:DHBP synthase RibB-like alpha/beta domain superfamily protein [Cardinium endosymbiont of Oedothorax gibbosus]